MLTSEGSIKIDPLAVVQFLKLELKIILLLRLLSLSFLLVECVDNGSKESGNATVAEIRHHQEIEGDQSKSNGSQCGGIHIRNQVDVDIFIVQCPQLSRRRGSLTCKLFDCV